MSLPICRSRYTPTSELTSGILQSGARMACHVVSSSQSRARNAVTWDCSADQNQLLIRQQEDLASVKDTVQNEMKSLAEVVKKSDKQTRQLTAKSVKEAVKAVNEEEERSKNLIVYGAQDDNESEWGYSCKIDTTSDYRYFYSNL
ncbi:hypothetical protein ACHWQZ_G012057 [Mnemiopsis leidyi]